MGKNDHKATVAPEEKTLCTLYRNGQVMALFQVSLTQSLNHDLAKGSVSGH